MKGRRALTCQPGCRLAEPAYSGLRSVYPRDHFCSFTQSTAAINQPMPANGMSDTKVQMTALIRQRMIAKTPTMMLATASV